MTSFNITAHAHLSATYLHACITTERQPREVGAQTKRFFPGSRSDWLAYIGQGLFALTDAGK